MSLSSRVESFEAQWSRLQQRMSELWLEVEGLKLAEHSYPEPNALVQITSTSTTNTSTQTREMPSSNATTQTDEDTASNLKLWLATATENELKRWRTAFSEHSGTPEQMALRSKLTDKELSDWRTAFEHIQGTPAQKAASSKEAIDELKEWHTSFTHVSGTPAKRAEASKTFLKKFSAEQTKNLELLRSEKALKSEVHQLQERNLNLSTELGREMSKREKLLRAFEEYQGTSNSQNETRELTSPTGPSSLRRGPEINNHRRSPNSGYLLKRKREVSEPDHQQNEPLPASQRRRVAYSNPEWNQYGRQATNVAQRATPQNVVGDQGPAKSSTMSSIPPAGAPMGSSRDTISSTATAPRSMSVQIPTSDPIGPSEVAGGIRRNSESTRMSAPGGVLDTRRPSIASATGRPCANESMPKQPWPLEKRWKHSMLKKEH